MPVDNPPDLTKYFRLDLANIIQRVGVQTFMDAIDMVGHLQVFEKGDFPAEHHFRAGPNNRIGVAPNDLNPLVERAATEAGTVVSVRSAGGYATQTCLASGAQVLPLAGNVLNVTPLPINFPNAGTAIVITQPGSAYVKLAFTGVDRVSTPNKLTGVVSAGLTGTVPDQGLVSNMEGGQWVNKPVDLQAVMAETASLNDVGAGPVLMTGMRWEFIVTKKGGSTKYYGPIIRDDGALEHTNPAFSAYWNGVAQTIITGNEIVLIPDTEEYDDFNWYDPVTGKYQPTIAGNHQLNASVQFTASLGVTRVMLLVYKNGALYKSLSIDTQGSSDNMATWNGGCTVEANGTSDYFAFVIRQDSGATKTIVKNLIYCYVQGRYVGRRSPPLV